MSMMTPERPLLVVNAVSSFMQERRLPVLSKHCGDTLKRLRMSYPEADKTRRKELQSIRKRH